jgi:hypothetical protein
MRSKNFSVLRVILAGYSIAPADAQNLSYQPSPIDAATLGRVGWLDFRRRSTGYSSEADSPSCRVVQAPFLDANIIVDQNGGKGQGIRMTP